MHTLLNILTGRACLTIGGFRLCQGHLIFLIGMTALALFSLSTSAQDAAQDAAQVAPQNPVSYDDVNAIAERMYCPECEFLPLDKCFTPVCLQWKDEIAAQLAAGRTEQEIRDDFVQRFGDQVLGIPQDNTLRSISLGLPIIGAVVIFIIGLLTFVRLRGRDRDEDALQTMMQTTSGVDDYRSRLEQDLKK